MFQIIAIDQLGKETGPSPAHSIVYRYLCFVATANKRFDKRDIKNLFIADIYMAKTSTMDVLQIYKKRVRINKWDKQNKKKKERWTTLWTVSSPLYLYLNVLGRVVFFFWGGKEGLQMSFKGQDCINIARVRGRGANGIQRSRLYRFCLDVDPIWLWMHHWAGDIVSSHISLLPAMFITLYKYHLSHWTLYIRCAVIRFESNDWSINVFWFTLSIWVYICVYIYISTKRQSFGGS